MTRPLTACIKPVRCFSPLWADEENGQNSSFERLNPVQTNRKTLSVLDTKHWCHMPAAHPTVCPAPGCGQEMPYWPPRTVRSVAGAPWVWTHGPRMPHCPVTALCPPADMTRCTLPRTLLNLFIGSGMDGLPLIGFACFSTKTNADRWTVRCFQAWVQNPCR